MHYMPISSTCSAWKGNGSQLQLLPTFDVMSINEIQSWFLKNQ